MKLKEEKDDDKTESDRVGERCPTDLRMKLKRIIGDEEEEENEEEIDAVYPISDKRIRTLVSVTRKITVLQSHWWPTT